tara:strand:- start:16785 stop:17501 length:717 start_codon:yes stop_codon:yes gene_type:complete
MKFGIIVFPGSNCDHDCYHIIRHVLEQEVDFLWHKDEIHNNYDCLILPGGFSYGDYLRPGAISRFSPIMDSVIEFAEKGGLLIGICNGFQVLMEAGLLPGAMMRNRRLKFICKNVTVKVENSSTPFTGNLKEGELLTIPIAHADGNYFADQDTLNKLEQNKQIVFKYSSPDGEVSDDDNPNGSCLNIAGISNEEGNVLGMMPHPERCSESILGNQDGLKIFHSILSANGTENFADKSS